MSRARIAVAGAGTIGKRHIEEIDSIDEAELAAIVDPGPTGPELAQKYGVALYQSLAELFGNDKPDGIILATPNQMHVDGALECVAAGVPVIVESGRLGPIVGVSGTALFYKPDDYFDENGGWRREPGGGPILLNLVHEVNNLLSLVGDIDAVQALTSRSTRGFPVEDTAAMIFRFANGALGTFLLSDTAGSARSWEQTSQENAAYATYGDEDAYHITGTTGSLSVPTMRVKIFGGKRSWFEPFETSTENVDRTDPLANQIVHFVDVIQNGAQPISSGRDGLKTLRVVDAVLEAARTGQLVRVNP